jgi:hypothetical protein
MSKKAVGILSLIFCMHAAGCAQLKFGLKAGLNVSRVHTNLDLIKKFTVLRSPPTRPLSGELLFSDNGFEKDGSTRLLYAEMPAMATSGIIKGLNLALDQRPGTYGTNRKRSANLSKGYILIGLT